MHKDERLAHSSGNRKKGYGHNFLDRVWGQYFSLLHVFWPPGVYYIFVN